jgi:hypothetical protein
MKVFQLVPLFLWLLGAVSAPAPLLGQNDPCCSVVQDALRVASQIKAGMTRRAVEKDFIPDGGLAFPLETTYVFKRCPLIKIRITFSPQPGKDSNEGSYSLSEEDRIASVSELFIAYQNRD